MLKIFHSKSVSSYFLQEIVSIYPALSPPTLSPGASNRVCNALALLQVSIISSFMKFCSLEPHICIYLVISLFNHSWSC